MDKQNVVQECLEKNVRLIAISKTKTNEEILEVFDLGVRDFGENKVQELARKHEELPKEIQWHMVGHLQKNKVKFIAPFIHLIHSVDSFELLEMIDKHARQNNRTIKVLLQIKIAEEESKYGLSQDEAIELVEKYLKGGLPNVRISGLMGMASFTDDREQINNEFAALYDFFIELKEVYFHRAYYFKELSMGMSSDYDLAIENGATMIRIGSLLFGDRNYG